MQAGCLEVPVNQQHVVAIARQDPGDVGYRHGAAGAALVRVKGDDLTLFLWLVDARNGNQVWGEQYHRKLTDLVALQREIATDVSEKLRVKLSGSTAQKLTKDYSANAEAYRLYLLGRFHVFKLTVPEVQQGIADLQKAIDLDPNYALAYVGLSEAYRSLGLGSELSPEDYLGRAKAASQKALQLDEQLAEAHSTYGSTVFWLDRNWTEAESNINALWTLIQIVSTHMCSMHIFFPTPEDMNRRSSK